MHRIFDGLTASKYDAEAQQRWGDTPAYEEAARRVKGYTPEQWTHLRTETNAIYSEAAALMKAGRAAADDDVLAIAERHRMLIDRWFYPCSPETHRGLASLYESDARFASAMDEHSPGLSTFLIAAIWANAERSRG